MSHKPRPIKVVERALSVAMKADEIAKETAETGKVTAVVAVMSIFKKKKMQIAERYSRKSKAFSPKSGKSQFFAGNFPRIVKPFSKNEKRSDTKEMSA